MTNLGVTLFATLLTAAGLAAQDNCVYNTLDGTVGIAGPDDRTYIETPIWAQLIMADGIASQILVAKQGWGAKPKLRRSNPELDAALLIAIKANDADKALQFLEQGASPDAVDPRYGYTALMLAARLNNREIVTALLQSGADVNARAKDGWTALMFSANCGDAGVGIAEMLLKAGADRNARHNDGYSALGILSGSSATQMQSLLRRYGVPQ